VLSKSSFRDQEEGGAYVPSQNIPMEKYLQAWPSSLNTETCTELTMSITLGNQGEGTGTAGEGA